MVINFKRIVQDDWETIYANDEKVLEGHSVSGYDVLEWLSHVRGIAEFSLSNVHIEDPNEYGCHSAVIDKPDSYKEFWDSLTTIEGVRFEMEGQRDVIVWLTVEKDANAPSQEWP